MTSRQDLIDTEAETARVWQALAIIFLMLLGFVAGFGLGFALGLPL